MSSKSVFSTIGISLLIALIYLPSLRNGFAFDDLIHIENNAQLRSTVTLWEALWEPMFPGNLYRPVFTLTNGALILAFGLDPLPHHILNIVLHASCIALLSLLLLRLHVSIGPLIGLIWGVLPIHVETVANCTGRAELLAAFWGLLAGHVALSCRLGHHYLPKAFLSGVLLLLAIWSKESAILWCIPLSILASRSDTAWRSRITATLPIFTAYIIVIVLSLLLRIWVLGDKIVSASSTSILDNPLLMYPLYERIFLAFVILGRYIVASTTGLYVGQECSIGGLLPASNVVQWVGWGMVAGVLLALICHPKSPVSRFQRIAFGWFFLFFAATGNIALSIGTVFGERLAYTPTMGLIAGLLLTIPSRLRVPTSLCAAALFTIQTSSLIPIWKSTTTLAQHHIKASPGSAKAQLNYSVVLRNDGDLDEATIFARAALLQYPDYVEAAYVLATIYATKKNDSGTRYWLQKCIAIDSSFPEALNMLGRLESNIGHLDGSAELFRQALTVSPNHVPSLVGLMAVEALRGNHDRSRLISERLRLLAPDNHEVLEVLRQLGMPR